MRWGPDDDLASPRDPTSGATLVMSGRLTPPSWAHSVSRGIGRHTCVTREFECHSRVTIATVSRCLGATVRFRRSPLGPRMGVPSNMRSRYADDALFVKRNQTKPDEIRAFVERRTLNPLEIEGVTVWNYNNHVPMKAHLGHTVNKYNLEEGSKWIIPYNVTPLWGYMHELLPSEVKEAGYILYDEEDGKYSTFPSIYDEGSRERDRELREELESCQK